MSSREVERRSPRAVTRSRPVVHYVQEVRVRPVSIMEEAARRPTRRTIEDTHPIFWLLLRALPYVFFLAAFAYAARLAWLTVTG